MRRLYVLIVATLVILCCLGVMSSRAFVLEAGDTNAYRTDNLLRLHILANTSSPEDQYLKREVRDIILRETKNFYKDIKEADRAVAVTSTNLPTLQRRVEEYLKSQGKDIPVKMELGRFEFPTRTYGNVTLPAGEYQALQVVLGEGEGNNWWCVLFPPLCMDNEKSNPKLSEKQLMSVAFSKDQGNMKVHYRFKLLSKLESVPKWVKSKF